MKNLYKLFIIFFILITTTLRANALQFDVLVLPTKTFSVCENYFCFPEPSEIVANEVINELNTNKYIKVKNLSEVRATLNKNENLKSQTERLLQNFEQNQKIDFVTLKNISNEFGVKSVVLISCIVTNDKSPKKRDLWEIMEISSAFKISYPFNLKTTAVLTDTVNNVVMWSGQYNKVITDSNDMFTASTQAQAASQLEKLKQYVKHNIGKTISQNIKLRFFPKEVRTFQVKKVSDEDKPQFIPNALEKLVQPQNQNKNYETDSFKNLNPMEDFIFEL